MWPAPGMTCSSASGSCLGHQLTVRQRRQHVAVAAADQHRDTRSTSSAFSLSWDRKVSKNSDMTSIEVPSDHPLHEVDQRRRHVRTVGHVAGDEVGEVGPDPAAASRAAWHAGSRRAPPLARSAATLLRHQPGSPSSVLASSPVDVDSSATPTIRSPKSSGCWSASARIVMPPIEWPTRTTGTGRRDRLQDGRTGPCRAGRSSRSPVSERPDAPWLRLVVEHEPRRVAQVATLEVPGTPSAA